MQKLSSKTTARIGAPSTAVAVILIGSLLVGYMLTMLSAFHSFVLVLLLLVSVCTFIWPEAGLCVVIFSMLLSPEIIAGEITGKATLGRGLTLRLEDFLLMCIGLSWFARTAVDKSMGLFRKTPLNQPIAAYILACFVATLWGKINGDVVGLTGFFFVLKYFEYMIVFFLSFAAVKNKKTARNLMVILAVVMILVSLYGFGQKFLGWSAFLTMNEEFSKGVPLRLPRQLKTSLS